MDVPVQVTFRDTLVNDGIESLCWLEAARLNRLSGLIRSCRVIVCRGRPDSTLCDCLVRVDLMLHSMEISVSTPVEPDSTWLGVEAAVRSAFEEAHRRMTQVLRRQERGGFLISSEWMGRDDAQDVGFRDADSTGAADDAAPPARPDGGA